MNHKNVAIVLFICSLAPCATLSAGKKDKIDPDALLARARSEEVLRTSGTSPTVIRADLQVTNGRAGVAHGEYLLAWASPSQWREEIRFSSYVRIRVGTDKGYWQISTPDYEPEVIFELDPLLDVSTILHVSPDDTTGKVKQRRSHGAMLQCVNVKRRSLGAERTLCFDATSGALVSVDNPLAGISRIEYKGFNTFAGKIVPYEIKATNDGQVVASMNVTAVGNLPGNNPALFTAPANAGFWPECDNILNDADAQPQRPKLLVYPDAAKQNHEQGTVVFYAVIEGDGSVSRLTPIQGPASDLISAAAAAVRTWRYKPVVCDGKPAHWQTRVTLVFTLGG